MVVALNQCNKEFHQTSGRTFMKFGMDAPTTKQTLKIAIRVGG